MSVSDSILKNKYGFENPFQHDSLSKKALRHLKGGKRLLDVGCGEGADSVFYAKHGFNVTAIDGNDEYLNRLRTFIKDKKLTNISIENGDVIHYHYRENFYDAISCW